MEYINERVKTWRLVQVHHGAHHYGCCEARSSPVCPLNHSHWTRDSMMDDPVTDGLPKDAIAIIGMGKLDVLCSKLNE